MSNDPSPVVPSPSAPTWSNWSGNLVHAPSTNGENYYFTPTNLIELKSVLAAADAEGVTVRVSGQRHSQPPLVTNDNRGAVPALPTTYLVDMSCYKDLGPDHDQSIVLGPGAIQVTVNAGVREDELDAFLTQNNLLLKTVTAGGFFSLGGMTAVDVHGGSMHEPIFAETVSAFNIVLADGTVKTINLQSPAVAGWSPLQFARVSLGALGIVTSVTIDVMERKYATTLQGNTERFGLADKSDFIEEFAKLVKHSRLETFFTPYATEEVGFPLYTKNFLALWWDVVDESTGPPNQAPQPYPPTACKLASQPKPEFGAPYMQGFTAKFGAETAEKAQYAVSPGNTAEGLFEDGLENPAVIAAIVFEVAEPQVTEANRKHLEMWLTGAVRVIFMSYYIPLPKLDAAGLAKVWDGMDVVSKIVLQDNKFHIAAPMEFRFVKAGNTAMSGTYTKKPEETWFVNLDLIGFVKDDKMASQYPEKLLQFFADVERAWVKMDGFPHQGKMYGFYDPTAAEGTYSETGPFNPKFLAHLRTLRGARLEAFNAYRKSLDPNGRFYNDFLRKLLEG